MTNASQGFAVLVLTLAAVAPLRAAQVGGTVWAHRASPASADSGSGRGAHHHHHHGGGKHTPGTKSLSFDTTTNTVTFKLVAERLHGRSRLHAADTLRFTSPAAGSYRIASGVAGQARAGMWIRLRVDPSARAPRWEKGATERGRR